MASYLYAVTSLFFIAAIGHNVRKLFSTTAVAMITAASVALMVDPFLYSGILIEIAVLFGVLLLVRGKRHTGALLLEGISLLGMIALLAAGWTLDIVGVTAGAVEIAVNIIIFSILWNCDFTGVATVQFMALQSCQRGGSH